MAQSHASRPDRNAVAFAASALALVFAVGCGHSSNVSHLPASQTAPPAAQGSNPGRIAPTPVPPGGVNAADLEFVRTHRPVLSEEGLATWYTAPYKGRKAANGEVFSDRALTACLLYTSRCV